MSEVALEVLEQMKKAVHDADGSIRVGPAWGTQGECYWTAQVYLRSKKIGPFLVASEKHGQSAAGALRSMADVLEFEP